jgi:integrase
MTHALTLAAREWVKLEPTKLTTLQGILRKLPRPKRRMSPRVKALLRQFDDAATKRLLFDLPDALWREVTSDKSPDWRTLDLAQCAIGIETLIYIPIRRKNLCGLGYGKHLFLRDRTRSISTLEIPAEEAKGGEELAFDIPGPLAQRMIDYREKIAPRIIGRRPTHIFVKATGERKAQLKISAMIKRCLKQRAGIDLHVHAFRHLHGKLILEKQPGSFETVRAVLGHKTSDITRDFYAGMNSQRAARHHRKIIEESLSENPKALSKRGRKRNEREEQRFE